MKENHICIVIRRLPTVAQASLIAITALGWFLLSNHCALAGLIAAKTQSAVAPMHCRGNQPPPPNKNGEEEMPCCKVLRATVTSEAKTVEAASNDFVPLQPWMVAEIIFADEAHLQSAAEELGTGPPFADSFAESVLRRSIFAHAPPFVA